MIIIEQKDGKKYQLDTKNMLKKPIDDYDEVIEMLIIDNLKQAEIIDNLIMSILELESR